MMALKISACIFLVLLLDSLSTVLSRPPSAAETSEERQALAKAEVNRLALNPYAPFSLPMDKDLLDQALDAGGPKKVVVREEEHNKCISELKQAPAAVQNQILADSDERSKIK